MKFTTLAAALLLLGGCQLLSAAEEECSPHMQCRDKVYAKVRPGNWALCTDPKQALAQYRASCKPEAYPLTVVNDAKVSTQQVTVLRACGRDEFQFKSAWPTCTALASGSVLEVESMPQAHAPLIAVRTRDGRLVYITPWALEVR